MMLSVFISLSEGDEYKLCIRCRANTRYELIAAYLRSTCQDLSNLVLVELDNRSPLRRYLSNSKEYIRTYYTVDASPGSTSENGSRCEDITHLTFRDSSIDVIISSDVLEHVPNLSKAFQETYRVLKPGGFHLFTVPVCSKTEKRAEIVNSELIHIKEPVYHSDPLNPDGILAFWDCGPDLGEIFSTDDLKITIVDGPLGKDRRILWKAEKIV
ncbi:MAG: class I SAM-dependent methyltransferase [Nitrospirae bacterium]|nr:class I SAM-dependent methyltransferase [Nitrospirota bacterium]